MHPAASWPLGCASAELLIRKTLCLAAKWHALASVEQPRILRRQTTGPAGCALAQQCPCLAANITGLVS